jgi:acetyl esterase/lipase
MRIFLFGLALFASSAIAQSGWPPAPEHPTLLLWPNGAPATSGPLTAIGPEHDTTTANDKLIAGRPLVRLGDVSAPTITLYAAPKATNTGAAVVVFPGGGYSILAIDLEGTEVCDWLNSISVNCVLLKYRVPNSGPYPKSSAALQDAQRAMGMVRQHAAELGIDPKRVGVLGFSAGGHLAAAISTHYDQRLYPVVDAADQLSCRPDFAIVIYPRLSVDCRKEFRVQSRHSRDLVRSADVSGTGGGRSGPRRERDLLLPGVEEGRSAGAIARLHERRPRLRAASNRAPRDALARLGGNLDA